MSETLKKIFFWPRFIFWMLAFILYILVAGIPLAFGLMFQRGSSFGYKKKLTRDENYLLERQLQVSEKCGK